MKVERASLYAYLTTASTILAIHLFWLASGEAPLTAESPFRIVLGALPIFILPGLFWGEVLRFRSDHVLKTIALAFALTLTIEVLILPFPFLLNLKISGWVQLLSGISLLGFFISAYRIHKTQKSTFIIPPFSFSKLPYPLNISSLILLAILIALSYGTYQWGENLKEVGSEGLIHVLFIRRYYSLPMNLSDLGLSEVPPPNLINLWEYLLAAWARSINSDPLPLFFRARFVIPILGFAGAYLFVRSVFADKRKAEIILWTILCMGLGSFFFLMPSEVSRAVNIRSLRGVMSFMGTVHHSDSAMDILLFPMAALIVHALRSLEWRNIFLLSGTLFATFLWHPREFFQGGLYMGVLGIAFLLFPLRRKLAAMKRWAAAFAVFVLVAGFFLFLSTRFAPGESHAYDELAIKIAAMKYAFLPENILGIRNLFRFPLHLGLSSSLAPRVILGAEELGAYFAKTWQLSMWLFFSSLASFLLIWVGTAKERFLGLFFLLLWFLALAWNFSMLIILAFTYSEFFISTPRIIYIFSYVVVAAASLAAFRLAHAPLARFSFGWLLAPAITAGAGLMIRWWWKAGLPLRYELSTAITISSAIFVLLAVSGKYLKGRPRAPLSFAACVLGIYSFFLPLLFQEHAFWAKNVVARKRPAVDWFGTGNPFGLSPEVIQFARNLPPKSNILVNPIGTALLSIYSPLQLTAVPVPTANLIQYKQAHKQTREGNHPLFRPHMGPYEVDYPSLKEYLARNRVDYIFVDKEHYERLHGFFFQLPDEFETVYDNPKKKELMVRRLPQIGPDELEVADIGRPGKLRVMLYPDEVAGAGAKWRRLGTEEWLESGAEEKLSAGRYDVEFREARPKSHWRTPSSVRVRVAPGRTSLVRKIYSKLGNLTVRLEPREAIEGGAKWRRRGTKIWLENGAEELGLPIGNYEVEFKEPLQREAWKTPSKKIVTITQGNTTEVTGAYKKLGVLQVLLDPPGAIEAGAKWRRVGTKKWLKSGAKESIPLGEHEIIFRAAYPRALWKRPSNIRIIVAEGKPAVVRGNYTRLGKLFVTLLPRPADPSNAWWHLVGSKRWSKSDYVTERIPAGEHEVQFNRPCPKVPRGKLPTVKVRVSQGKLTKVTVKYDCKKLALVSAVIR